MTKSKLFKKFLACTLASATICSSGVSKCEAYRPTSTAEAVITLTTLTLGTVAVVAGGTAAIALTVHTGNVSKKIYEKEVKIAALESDISRLEAKIRNTSPKNICHRMKLETELEGLQHQLSLEKFQLANLKIDYRESCQDLYWQQQNMNNIQHMMHHIESITR